MKEREKIKLKPCPFCGEKARIRVWERSRDTYTLNPDRYITIKLPSKYLVECSNKQCNACQPRTKYFYTKKKAIEAWNGRIENER